MATLQSADDSSALDGIAKVSHETNKQLNRLVELVRKWQPAENLVAPSTLPTIWRRHIADSAQLVTLFPEARIWLDLGSGAGFPGLVVAILLAGHGGRVHLVESNSRKCAFLRLAVRETGAPATVHEARIETVVAGWRDRIDLISARALAPLDRLLAMVAPLVGDRTHAVFHKGQDFVREIDEATKSWDLDLIRHRSLVDDSSAILEIGRVAERQATQTRRPS